MNRKPRTETEIYDWHTRTLAHIALYGEKDRGRPPIHENEPHPGWYRRRLVPKGAFVPVKIWIEPGETDPATGEMIAPEKMLCEVDGKRVDVFRTWTWVAQHPISEDDYMAFKAGYFRGMAPEPAPVTHVAREVTSEPERGPDPMAEVEPEQPRQPGQPLF